MLHKLSQLFGLDNQIVWGLILPNFSTAVKDLDMKKQRGVLKGNGKEWAVAREVGYDPHEHKLVDYIYFDETLATHYRFNFEDLMDLGFTFEPEEEKLTITKNQFYTAWEIASNRNTIWDELKKISEKK